jgi:alcohol dehydrogenase YqhD (iron-dependent ADH family)
MSGKKKPQNAIPIVSVLTLAATGTEMNMFAVLQNNKTKQKLGYGHPMIYPAESFLDPVLTFSVPADYTAYGIADLIAHSLEGYFGKGEAQLSDRIVFGILKETIDYAEPLLDNPTDYDLRARMMYAATLALNGMTNNGRAYGDWGVHDLGHSLSLLFDVAHGASLSIVYPAWMKFFKHEITERLELLGKEVFGVKTADECIIEIEKFYRKIGAPTNLKDIELKEEQIEQLLDYYNHNRPNGRAHKLKEGDYKQLVDLMRKI